MHAAAYCFIFAFPGWMVFTILIAVIIGSER